MLWQPRRPVFLIQAVQIRLLALDFYIWVSFYFDIVVGLYSRDNAFPPHKEEVLAPNQKVLAGDSTTLEFNSIHFKEPSYA